MYKSKMPNKEKLISKLYVLLLHAIFNNQNQKQIHHRLEMHYKL